MQTNKYIFLPETGSIWVWLIIAGIATIGLLILMYRLSGINRQKTATKYNPLLFLLSGLFFLISITIFTFSIFNLVQSKPCIIENGVLSKGSNKMTLSSIRKTMIHREGTGVPFQGLGVEQGTNNSLIIVDSAGRSIIFSEDFYPVDSVIATIQKLKGKE